MLKQRLAETRRSKARGNDKGFTLIELLIVIVVLGILAGIVVFGVGTFRGDSELAACKANLKTVSVASDAYFAKVGTKATDVATLVTANYLKTAPPAVDAIQLVAGDPVSAYPGGQCTLT